MKTTKLSDIMVFAGWFVAAYAQGVKEVLR
jgi:hypothetical protein